MHQYISIRCIGISLYIYSWQYYEFQIDFHYTMHDAQYTMHVSSLLHFLKVGSYILFEH